MEFYYEDIIKRYREGNWYEGRNEGVSEEEEAFMIQTLKDHFRSGQNLTSEEIKLIFYYDIFPWECGDIVDEGRHGWVVYEYIFTIEDDEHYMMTFWRHDDYGIEDYEEQPAIRCYYKEVKVMKWVCEGEE